MRGNEQKRRSSWALKGMLLLGAGLLSLIAVAISKETYRKNLVQQEIGKLQNEATQVERENLTIAEKIRYFESRDYQEKEAKDKLNLQSPDENLVVITPSVSRDAPKSDEEAPRQALSNPQPDKRSNTEKWWAYFFSYNDDTHGN